MVELTPFRRRILSLALVLSAESALVALIGGAGGGGGIGGGLGGLGGDRNPMLNSYLKRVIIRLSDFLRHRHTIESFSLSH